MRDARTPSQWCAATGLVVIDPDGWRSGTKVLGQPFLPRQSWNTPITLMEFTTRVYASTCNFKDCPVGRLYGLEPLLGGGDQRQADE